MCGLTFYPLSEGYIWVFLYFSAEFVTTFNVCVHFWTEYLENVDGYNSSEEYFLQNSSKLAVPGAAGVTNGIFLCCGSWKAAKMPRVQNKTTSAQTVFTVAAGSGRELSCVSNDSWHSGTVTGTPRLHFMLFLPDWCKSGTMRLFLSTAVAFGSKCVPPAALHWLTKALHPNKDSLDCSCSHFCTAHLVPISASSCYKFGEFNWHSTTWLARLHCAGFKAAKVNLHLCFLMEYSFIHSADVFGICWVSSQMLVFNAFHLWTIKKKEKKTKKLLLIANVANIHCVLWQNH